MDLPEGADLYVHYAAAQRDPEIFDDPDALDVHRPNVKRHFAFGRGVHTCLGAPLARLEARVALECLIDRLPSLRLAPDAPPERWIPSMLTPGWNGLTWNGTRSAPRRREVTMTTTMPALDIDPFIDDVLAEPTDFHRRLRAAGPAVKVRQSEGLTWSPWGATAMCARSTPITRTS